MPRLNDIVPRPREEDKEDKAAGEICDPKATGVPETDLRDNDPIPTTASICAKASRTYNVSSVSKRVV